MAYAKALLLVHDQKSQVLKLHILGQKAVGADQYVQLSRPHFLQRLPVFFRAAEAADHADVNRKPFKPLDEGSIMLLYQNGGGGQHGYLLAAHYGAECGAHGHLSFAVAYIAAQQAIHIDRLFHI